MVHVVKIAEGTTQLEMCLDNGSNRGWTLVTILEQTERPGSFYVIHKKEEG